MSENNPVIIRPALKRACCDDDACRAAIYNQLLFSIARKVKAGKDYWYGTGEDIYNAVDQSWGISKVNKEVKALISAGLVGQRRNPENGWDQTRQYLFTKEQAAILKKMCEKAGVCIQHHMCFSADVLHLLKITNAFDESNKCICSIHQIDLLKILNRFVKSNEAIPKDTTKVTTKVTTKDTKVTCVIASAMNTDPFTFSPLEPQGLDSENITPLSTPSVVEAFDGWLVFKNETSSQVSTQQANAVENPGQLADSSTVSQARDNGVREATDSLDVENGADLPALSLESLTPLSPNASQSEVVQASNGHSPIAAVATRNPDEEQAILSRSGEDATTSDGVPTTPPRSGASGRNKRTRTSEDETVKARVERVFAYFDTLKQETTGKPEEHYARTKAAAKEIKDTLLPCGPTELKLRKVYLKLWNTPPSKGSNFDWKDHMTIKAVCGQYESVMLAVDADEKVEAEKKRAKQALESIVKSPPILVQAEDDYVFDIERVRGNRGRRSAS